MNKVPAFTGAIAQALSEYGVKMDDVGIYVQPMERGRACHFECNIFYDPDKPGDVSRVGALYEGLGERFIHMGALFTTPHGPMADMVYSRAASYTAALKKVKNLLDPNQILSPGRLCF
jgi:FAD/FMN-containing dehydrogenase